MKSNNFIGKDECRISVWGATKLLNQGILLGGGVDYFFLARLARAAAKARIPLLLLLLALVLFAGAVFVRGGAGWACAGTPKARLCFVGAAVVRPAICCWAGFSFWLRGLGAAADWSTRGAAAACADARWAGARGSGDDSGVPNSSLEEFGLFGLFK